MCLPCFKHNCLEESAKCAYLAARTLPWRRVQCVPTLLQAQLLGGECNVGLPCCQNHSLECTVCLPCFKKQTLMESILCACLALRTIPQRRVHCVPTLTSCASCMVRGWWGSCCRWEIHWYFNTWAAVRRVCGSMCSILFTSSCNATSCHEHHCYTVQGGTTKSPSPDTKLNIKYWDTNRQERE